MFCFLQIIQSDFLGINVHRNNYTMTLQKSLNSTSCELNYAYYNPISTIEIEILNEFN